MQRSCSNCSLWKTDNTETGKPLCPHAPTSSEGFCADHRAAPVPRCGDCTWFQLPRRNKTCFASGRAGSPNKGGRCTAESSVCSKFERKASVLSKAESDIHDNNSGLPLSTVCWKPESAVVLRHSLDARYGLVVAYHGNGFTVQPVFIDSFGAVVEASDLAAGVKEDPATAPLVNATKGSAHYIDKGRIKAINLGATGVVTFVPTETTDSDDRPETAKDAVSTPKMTPSLARAVEAYHLLVKSGVTPEQAVATAAARTGNAMDLSLTQSIKMMSALKAMFLKGK